MEADLDGAGGGCTEKRGGGSKRDEIVGDLGCDGAVVDLHGRHVLETEVGSGACLEGGGEGELGDLEDRRALAAVAYGGEDTGNETEDKQHKHIRTCLTGGDVFQLFLSAANKRSEQAQRTSAKNTMRYIRSHRNE